jgi:hypothetical protein
VCHFSKITTNITTQRLEKSLQKGMNMTKITTHRLENEKHKGLKTKLSATCSSSVSSRASRVARSLAARAPKPAACSRRVSLFKNQYANDYTMAETKITTQRLDNYYAKT